MKRKIKFLFLTLIMGCVFFGSASVSAAISGDCGRYLEWELDNGTLTISGYGDMSNWNIYQYSYAPWNRLAENIESIVISDGVTGIGRCAFYNCESLTSITIPNSISYIGNDAFTYSGIKKVYFMGTENEWQRIALNDKTITFDYELISADRFASLCGTFYLAAYDADDRFLGVYQKEIDIADYECEVSSAITVDKAPAYIKVFFWGGETETEPFMARHRYTL